MLQEVRHDEGDNTLPSCSLEGLPVLWC